MRRQVAGVTDRTDDNDPVSRTFVYHLRNRIIEIAFFKVAARRNIYDTNVMTIFIFKNEN